jgi:hypothetical protein
VGTLVDAAVNLQECSAHHYVMLEEVRIKNVHCFMTWNVMTVTMTSEFHL